MPRVWMRRRKGRDGRPWTVFWIEPNGQRKQETIGKDKDAAEEFKARKLLELGQAAPIADRDVTLEQFGKQWIRDAAPGLKRASVVSYMKSLARMEPLWKRRMRDIQQQDGVAFLSDLLKVYAEGTVKTTYGAMSRMFQRAVFRGVLLRNPMRNLWVELPVSVRSRRGSRLRTADESKAKAMTYAERDRLLAAEGAAGACLFAVTYHHGLRIGETLGLQLDDVDFPNRQLNIRRRLEAPSPGLSIEDRVDVPKGGVSRIVRMSAVAREILAGQVVRRREENLRNAWTAPWLFVDEDGDPLDYFKVERSFRRLIRRTELPVRFTPHSLRHSYATHMLQAGARIAWVARQLGDRIDTLLTWYTWALPDGDDSDADLLDSGASGSREVAVAQASRFSTGSVEVNAPQNRADSEQTRTDVTPKNPNKEDRRGGR